MKQQNKEDAFVSLVLVADGGAKKLPSFIRSTHRALASNYLNYEMVIVTNGFDAKETKAVAKLLETLPGIRIIRLSYKTKHDAALFAGLETAIGDHIVTFNPLIDGTKTIKAIVDKNKKADIVQGVSSIPLSVFGGNVGRRLFYWYNRKYIGVDIPLNATYLAAYSRRALNSLTSTKRSIRHIRHISRLIGYDIAEYHYTPILNPARHRTLKTGVIEALEIVTTYSSHPLRFVTWLGVVAALIDLLYAVYVVVLHVSNVEVAEGWTTTSLQISGMFFFLFLILVVLAEYIGRILTESQKDPVYYIADELTSTARVADEKRRNITK